MSDSSHPIRSYQRIFRPERRIYQIDGHRLPVPGGVSLQSLGWAFGALVLILVLAERSIVLALVLGAIGALLGASSHGIRGAVLAGAVGFLGVLVAGVVLGWLAWPLRLVVVPGMVAVLAGQASPDGRPAHRYLTSWVSVRLRPARRSLERPIPVEGAGILQAYRLLSVACDGSVSRQIRAAPLNLAGARPLVELGVTRRHPCPAKCWSGRAAKASSSAG